jgi:hypothetical protein
MPYVGVILFFMIMLSPLFPALLLGGLDVVERIFNSKR